MAEEEQNQEQNAENAEASEAVEAGAEAVEEVAGAEAKAPSILMPMLLSAVITVVGVGVMVAVILPKKIEEAIAAGASTAHHGDANGTGHGDGGHGDEHGGDEHGGDEHGGDEHGGDEAEEGDDTAATAEDDPHKPEPIVPEGETIVINPANSNGTRYLLVEIYLLRDNEKDTAFPKEVAKHTKQLQALTVDYLSAEDAQSLANPVTKERIKAQLKLAYQDKLGGGHPIKELIVSKWIMQ
jgi:flagellar basal body-associated protein FliL